MTIGTIIANVEAIGEDVIAQIEAEAKTLAAGAVAYAKPMVGDALDLFVGYVKETTFGTSVANLISAASSSTVSGAEKFAAVLLAAKDAWAAFVGAGGVSGVWAQFKGALVYVVQKMAELIFPALAIV